jgi:hypothetical protein
MCQTVLISTVCYRAAGQLSRYSDWLRVRRSGDRIPVRGKIFRTRTDRPWGPPSLLHSGYRVCFPGEKRPGRDVDHPPPSSAEIKESVELHIHSRSGPSWPILGWPLPLPLRNRTARLQFLTQPHVHVCISYIAFLKYTIYSAKFVIITVMWL